MPDGEMRRPPQLWEQRLSRLTSVLGVGLGSSGATSIVDPTPAPGTGGGVEPAPVLPPPGDFIAPSTPTLIGQVQGINVIWDGLNSAGDLWPYDTSWVEVHLDTSGTAFTPGTATLQGRLARPGNFYLGGLSAGTAYYVKLMGADPAGNYTDPSDAATGYTGLTTSSDYGTATIGSGAVSFDARAIGGVTTTVGTATPSGAQDGDIWLDTTGGATTHKRYNGSTWQTQAWGTASLSANCITATQIAAGAVTAGAISAGAVTTDKLTAGTINGFYITGSTISAGYLSGGTISGGYISGGTVNSGYINGGTVVGAAIKSQSSGQRVEISSSQISLIDSTGTNGGALYGSSGGLVVGGGSALTLWGGTVAAGDIFGPYLQLVGGTRVQSSSTTSDLYLMRSSGDSGYLNCQRVYDPTPSASSPNVIVGANGRIYRGTVSSQRWKHEIVGLRDNSFSPSVTTVSSDDALVCDYYDVLDVTPAQFRYFEEALAEDGKPAPEMLSIGLIAEDVADKFPVATLWGEDEQAESYDTRTIVAALLQVVKDQQSTITALTARIEALEA